MNDKILLSVEAQQMRQIRNEYGKSQAEFGVLLADTVQPGKEPYTYQYISGMESGRMAITPEIQRALGVLASMLDGVSELQARSVEVRAYAVHPETDGAIIIPPPRQCKLPGCRVRFVGYPAQRFCSPECRKEYRRRVSRLGENGMQG